MPVLHRPAFSKSCKGVTPHSKKCQAESNPDLSSKSIAASSKEAPKTKFQQRPSPIGVWDYGNSLVFGVLD
jgi:hypothetical protein